MEAIFFEVILDEGDMLAVGHSSQYEVEDALANALRASGIDEVTGGGAGIGKANIDVDLNLVVPEEEGIRFIRATLRSLNVPRSTVIVRYRPEEREYPVWSD